MSTRERILRRDGFTCQCCGIVRSDHEIDHRIPLEQGGSNGDSNLWTLCHDCHARKTADEAKQRRSAFIREYAVLVPKVQRSKG